MGAELNSLPDCAAKVWYCNTELQSHSGNNEQLFDLKWSRKNKVRKKKDCFLIVLHLPSFTMPLFT